MRVPVGDVVDDAVEHAEPEFDGVSDGDEPTERVAVGEPVSVVLAVPVRVPVPVCVTVRVPVCVGELDGVAPEEIDGVIDDVGVSVGRAVSVSVPLVVGELDGGLVGRPVPLTLGVFEGDAPGESDALGVTVRLDVRDALGVGVSESGSGGGVLVADAVPERVSVPDAVPVGVAVFDSLAEPELLGVTDGEAPTESDAVGVAVRDPVDVVVGVRVGEDVAVGDGVGAGVPDPELLADDDGDDVALGDAVALGDDVPLGVRDGVAPIESDAVGVCDCDGV